MTRLIALMLVLSLTACGDDARPDDAGSDAADVGDSALDTGGVDAGETDTGADVGDAGTDVGDDAGEDVGEDVGDDVGVDAGEDAGDSGLDASGDASADTGDGGPVGCDAAVDAGDSAALVGMSPARWGGSARDADRPSTVDFVATGDFDVLASDFPFPDDCAEFCREEGPELRVRGPIDGVSVEAGRVSISEGALFRLRFDIPSGGLIRPIATVFIERAACSDCTEGGRRCEVDQACYSGGRTFCLECEGERPNRCACVDSAGEDVPDGTECFFATGDIAFGGVCRAGFCEPDM